MARDNFSNKVNALFRQAAWDEARELLEKRRVRDSSDHWVLTQLGVTYYEQRRYEEALPLFLASLRIVADCPLTLWNLAGTLDAVKRPADAVRIYTWLLQCKKSPNDDPCWESKAWADALKVDCIYRLGACFRQLGERRPAEDCFRQYVNLLSIGIEGSYSLDDVKRQFQVLRGTKTEAEGRDLQKAFDAALEASGIEPQKGRRKSPPALDLAELLMGYSEA